MRDRGSWVLQCILSFFDKVFWFVFWDIVLPFFSLWRLGGYPEIFNSKNKNCQRINTFFCFCVLFKFNLQTHSFHHQPEYVDVSERVSEWEDDIKGINLFNENIWKSILGNGIFIYKFCVCSVSLNFVFFMFSFTDELWKCIIFFVYFLLVHKMQLHRIRYLFRFCCCVCWYSEERELSILLHQTSETDMQCVNLFTVTFAFLFIYLFIFMSFLFFFLLHNDGDDSFWSSFLTITMKNETRNNSWQFFL